MDFPAFSFFLPRSHFLFGSFLQEKVFLIKFAPKNKEWISSLGAISIGSSLIEKSFSSN